jgi:hypothetical protein
MMTQILNATCVNGGLVLERSLSPEMEGQRLEIIVQTVTKGEAASFDQRFAKFEAQAQTYCAKLPSDYKFDRNEIYDR